MRTKTAFALIGALVLALISPVAAQAATAQETVFSLTNAHRAANSKTALKAHAGLDAMAQAWAKELASSGTLKHNPNLSTQAPSGWTALGENVAYNCGYSSPVTQLVTQWKNSAGHNENMLNSAYTHLGVGVAKDSKGCTWGVQVFAKYPSTTSAAAVTYTFTKAPKPTISGTLKSGYTLSAKKGTWSPAPSSYSYQWLRNGAAIKGATKSTYKLTTADRGKTITLKVTAKRSGYTTKSSVSAGKYVPKVFTKAVTPTIKGTAKAGKVLTATRGTWSPAATTYSFQWYRNGVKISGATASKYTLKAADRGKKITVKVTGKKSGYLTTTKTSAPKTVAK